MRDDPDAKTVFADAGDREAHAVDGDGTLVDDVTHDFRRRGNVEHVVLTGAFPARDAAGAVDVAGDEVSAEAAVGAERTLEVHERTGTRKLQIRPPPGFLQQIKLREPVASARRELHDGETATVDRKAVAELEAAAADAQAHRELDGLRGWFNAFDRAGLFDDAGKHGGKVTAPAGGVQPSAEWGGRTVRNRSRKLNPNLPWDYD